LGPTFLVKRNCKIARSEASSANCFLGRRQKAFTLCLLSRKLTLAADGFGLFSCALFGRLFIGAARLDFPEDTFTLHLLLQDPEGLIDIVISN